MKEWLEILQFAPIKAFFWISTKVHESAHLGVVPDGTAIQIDMIEDLYTLPNLDVGRDALGGVDNKIL
jgi:hypothetical protein